MANNKIVVVGGSAGSIEALKGLVSRLPEDFPAAMLVVVHIPSDFPSYLPHILGNAGPLRAIEATHGERIEPGVIYIAPPDRHLLIEDGVMTVTRGPRENRHRPAIDPLFRSGARSYGRRAIGVVLSGQLDDGSSGLMAIKMRGGLTVVQDLDEALCPEMPRRAKHYADAEYELPVAQIADLLVQVANEGRAEKSAGNGEMEMADEVDKEAYKAKLESQANKEKDGHPSAFACPECHGVMWEVEEGELVRYRCRVGHSFTEDSLRLAFSDSVEEALWAAMRVMEEKGALLRRIAGRAGDKQATSYNEEATGFDRHVETIRKLLVENQKLESKEEGKAQGA